MPVNKKTSELPEADPNGSEILIKCVQDGADKKLTRAATGAGVISVFSRTRILNNDEILASPTTEVYELVPAPGAGKLVVPLAVYMDADFSAGAYAGEDMTDGYVTVVYQGPSEFMDAHMMAENGAFFGNANARMYVFRGNVSVNSWGNAPIYLLKSGVTNKALQLYVASFTGNLTGGHANNTLKVTTIYGIVDV